MTFEDFRLLVARISLAAPMRPALIAVKVPVKASNKPVVGRPAVQRD